MLKNDFMESMKRVLAFSKPPETEVQAKALEAYLDALFSLVLAWNSIEFNRVCEQLVTRVNCMTRPDPKKFYEIRRTLQEESKRTFGRATCETCGGTRMVMRTYKFKGTEDTIEAAKPCPTCQRERHDAHQVNDRLVEVE